MTISVSEESTASMYSTEVTRVRKEPGCIGSKDCG